MENQTEEKQLDDKSKKDDAKTPAMIGVENRNHGRRFAVFTVMFFIFILVGAVVVISAVLCILSQLGKNIIHFLFKFLEITFFLLGTLWRHYYIR